MRWIVIGLLIPIVLLLAVLGLARAHLTPRRDACVAIVPGTLATDAEAALHRDFGAGRTGYGGLAGGPIEDVEVGVRGDLLSWECAMAIDPDGRVTSARFVPWISPSVPGTRRLETWLVSLLPH